MSKKVKKGFPDTTCSEPSVTTKTGNISEKRFYQLIPRKILGKDKSWDKTISCLKIIFQKNRQ